MEASSAANSSRRDQPPPYKPPSPGDRLFYLLLTATATSVVYKSFPERFRGISALAVGSFGLYHSFGLTCECVQDTVNKIFGGFGRPGGSSGSGGGYWGCFPSWDTRSPWNIPRGGGWQPPPSHHTGGIDRGERQEKRRHDPQRTWDTPLYPSARRDERSPSPTRRGSSLPTSVSVDRSGRQEKRRGGQPRTDAFGNEMKGWE
ncbi:MAG: hypothetical protein KFB93_05920 [Simkaniaceae bacterium]|nr:MAG: hypothetical protein KFB93_05920 [Simkaniaceae bacterium]